MRERERAPHSPSTPLLLYPSPPLSRPASRTAGPPQPGRSRRPSRRASAWWRVASRTARWNQICSSGPALRPRRPGSLVKTSRPRRRPSLIVQRLWSLSAREMAADSGGAVSEVGDVALLALLPLARTSVGVALGLGDVHHAGRDVFAQPLGEHVAAERAPEAVGVLDGVVEEGGGDGGLIPARPLHRHRHRRHVRHDGHAQPLALGHLERLGAPAALPVGPVVPLGSELDGPLDQRTEGDRRLTSVE